MAHAALGLSSLLALAIIVIGLQWILKPRPATVIFGLLPPEDGPNIAWWLRLKGVRDVVSGLAVFSMLAWGGPRMVGILLLVYTLIPVGDMLTVLAGRGSRAGLRHPWRDGPGDAYRRGSPDLAGDLTGRPPAALRAIPQRVSLPADGINRSDLEETPNCIWMPFPPRCPSVFSAWASSWEAA